MNAMRLLELLLQQSRRLNFIIYWMKDVENKQISGLA